MAKGDYDVIDGMALVDGDSLDDAMGLGLVNNEIAWGIGLADGLSEDVAASLTGLDDGMVAILEGLSGFNYLGGIEDKAYRWDEDMSYGEGYPLGGVLADVTADNEFPTEERGFMPDAGDSGYDDEGGDYRDQQQDGAGPTDEYEDELMDARTPDEGELARIVAARREAIEEAIRQRAIATEKVAELDEKIVGELEPAYQAALMAGDQAQAMQIGVRMRAYNLERQAAVQKALDWAQFQTTASQLTKNAKAQLALMKLFFQIQAQDPKTAAQVAAAYQEIGTVTAQIKAARARALAYAAAKNKAAKVKHLQLLERLYTTKYKRLGAIGARANTPQYAAEVARLRQEMATLQDQQKTLKAEIAEINAASPAAQALQGLGAVASRRGSIPYCEVYTRDAYGPTCAQQGEVDMGGGRLAGLADDGGGLGDLGAWYDTLFRVSAGVATGGASELALNREASGELKKSVSKIGEASSWFAKNVTCPVTKKLSGSKDLQKAGGAAELMVAAASGVCGMADKKDAMVLAAKAAAAEKDAASKGKGKHDDDDFRDAPWYTRPGPVLALALVGGGVIGGIVLATRAPERRLQGLGRGRR